MSEDFLSSGNVFQKQAIKKEITAIETVLKYIAKYNLESRYPPGGLEKQILLLEIKKGKINNSAKLNKPHTDPKSRTAPSSSVPCGVSGNVAGFLFSMPDFILYNK